MDDDIHDTGRSISAQEHHLNRREVAKSRVGITEVGAREKQFSEYERWRHAYIDWPRRALIVEATGNLAAAVKDDSALSNISRRQLRVSSRQQYFAVTCRSIFIGKRISTGIPH